MKYLIVPIAIFTALLSGIQTKAQTAPFAIYSASDSTWGPMCLAPSTIDFYMYGVAGAFNPQIDVVTCAIHYGDGTSDTVNVNVYGDFTYADFWAATQHEYTAPGTYTVYYEAWGTPLSGTTFYYDSLIVSNEIIISDTCGSVSGTAYYDTNNNCVYDAGELPMPNLCIALYEGGQAVAYDYTDADGSYDFDAPINGTYEVQLLSQTFNNVCPGNVQSVGAVPNTSLDFALFCDTAYFDLAGTLSAWQVRPGFDGYLYLFLSNNGCLPQSGTATIVLDPVTTYNGYCSQPNAITANGSTLTIDFAALVGGQDGALFQIGIYTDPAAFLNTQACFLLNVTPTTGDSDPANNSDNYCFTVTNSWDPNDKAVTPANGPDG
ncbi:MAG: hypothetical protein K9J06_15215, partial [Flavobacteriales bacterium]|nr:hypothetical protein [Flavobacteriales bacterium]